jgi:hypothetical protein
MAIGGAAVITMQKTSVTANLDARKADVANSIARTWVERLQRDAMLWTQPGPSGGTSNLANAPILNTIGTSEGTWFLPTLEMSATTPETNSPAFDILGRDLPLDQFQNADFCVNIRLTYLSGAGQPQDFIRADVRVIWPIGIINSYPTFCTDTAGLADPNKGGVPKVDPNADPNTPVFHTLYLTTSIKENAQ